MTVIRKKSLISDQDCTELFRLKNFPVHMLVTENEEVLYNDLVFGIDESCGFIQLLETYSQANTL